ncbi:MAG: hypothetical protein PWP31_384 [Clostridia bacterium]|nr:hypothetical protein [Clostridia bacterium]
MSQEKRQWLWARLEDLARQAEHSVRFTGFLDPAEQMEAKAFFNQNKQVNFAFNGGYLEAERKIAIIYPDYIEPKNIELPLANLIITWNERFNSPNHRDFLGALLGTGLRREVIGDIIVGKGRCQVIIFTESGSFLEFNLTEVGKTPVKASLEPLSSLEVPPRKVKVIKATVTSPRLDTLLAKAFGLSRSKTIPLIKGGQVKLNWQEETNPDRKIDDGDILSLRGHGRATVKSIGGKTKKGRLNVLLERWL